MAEFAEAIPSLRVGFIYNHEVPHQVAHTAPILKELLLRYPSLDIDVLTSTEEQKNLVKSGLGTELSKQTRFIDLEVGKADRGVLKAANAVAPARRISILKNNIEIFREYDVFVVPESTSLILKSQFGLDHLKFILTHHGAGDRSVTEKESIRDFDFVLVPGEKLKKRHLERGLIRKGSYAVCGYPKFDFVPHTPANINLFDNDNPIVVYNPHFDPYLSSWYDMGQDVLEAFLNAPDINLIFAPHIMLFQRKLHTSVEHKRVKFRKSLPDRFYNAANIHIDLGSTKSVDMTYTRSADIYLGDVSSQVYEFLERRRPTIFLNSHEADWAGNPFYMSWTTGPVLNSVENLIETVREASDTHDSYLPAQNFAFEETFDFFEGKASAVAADSIAEFLKYQSLAESELEAAE